MCAVALVGPFLTSVGLFEWADETRIPAEFFHAAGRPRQDTDRTGTVGFMGLGKIPILSSFILRVR